MVRGFSIDRLFSLQLPKNASKIAFGGLVAVLVIVLLYTVLWWLGFPTSIQGEILGVPFDVSILTLIMVCIFWVDGNIYIIKHHMGLNRYHYAIASTIVTFVVIGSVVVHEFAHGIVSTAFGNNIDHAGISWWGAFVAPSTTISQMSPLQQILVAAAGPFANFAIAGIAVLIVWYKGESLFENTVQYLAVINIKLGRFNLFPLLVLDGGKVVDGFLRLFVQDQMARIIMSTVVWVVFIYMYRKYRKNNPPLEDRLSSL
jgi:Zn-dependent protease